MALHVLDHPLADHLMAELRNESTEPASFRRHAKFLTMMLILEATRNLPTQAGLVTTPLEETHCARLGASLTAVPILRAGLAMIEPVMELFPAVNVGYIGLERDEATAEARRYYLKLPAMEGTYSLCLDPMLATGGSAAQAIAFIKEKRPQKVVMVSVVAAPEGVAKLQESHPDVDIYTAALDRGLNLMKYILPGLGDFGDRLYGTF